MSALAGKTREQYEDLIAFAALYADRRAALLEFAADPGSGAEDLFGLYLAASQARGLDRELRRLIASNPGIAIEDHFRLIAYDHPEELAGNPAFQAAIARDPEIIQYWEGELTGALLQHCPPSVAAVVVAHAEAITFSLLRENAFSEEHFRAMLPAALPAWRDELLQNPHLPQDLRDQPAA